MKNGKPTQFNSKNQPSGGAKSKGWARKRLRNEFMDLTLQYQEMTLKEFDSLLANINKNKSLYTVKESMAIRYVEKTLTSDKYLLDWVDRHIGKPSTDSMQETDKGEKISGYTLEIIDKTKDVENV